MTETEWLLNKLGQECNEVAHRVSKAMEFGLDETQPGQPFSNRERIEQELIDVRAVVEMLRERDILAAEPQYVTGCAENEVQLKKEKVLKYLRYAREECGTVKG